MRPRLIHPVDVVIYLTDKEKNVIDTVFKENRNETMYQKDPVQIKAQIKYDSSYDEKKRNLSPGGDNPLESGYLLIVFSHGKDIEVAAKITSIATLEVEYYVTKVRPAGIYKGKPSFLKIFFEKRRRG